MLIRGEVWMELWGNNVKAKGGKSGGTRGNLGTGLRKRKARYLKSGGQ